MVWRLITKDSSFTSKVVGHKILWTWAFLTLMPLLYLFIYSFKILDRWIKLKMMLAYSIMITEWLLVIIHYGFIPKGNNFNSFSSLTQALVRFIFYAYVFYILFHDATKLMEKSMTRSKAVTLITIFAASLIYIIGLMVLGYIERIHNIHSQFCTSMAWIFIKGSHFVMSLMLIALGWAITNYVKKLMSSRGYDVKARKIQPLKALWVIILTSVIDSTLELLIEVGVIIVDPDNWYLMSSNDFFNAFLWIIFRLLATNLWIWPSLYVFNSRAVVKAEKHQRLLIQEESYDQFDEAPPMLSTQSKEIRGTFALQNHGSGISENDARKTLSFERNKMEKLDESGSSDSD